MYFTLNKAVQFMNGRVTISTVQKAGRNLERAKKRKADEMDTRRSGDVPGALGGLREPIVRSTRAMTARGKTS